VSAQPVVPTLRERRREETLRAILDAAHDQLVADGAAALSLRAVARDVGMAVSALYRYVPSRDDLLTELVVAGFAAQADAVERALEEAGDPVEALGAGLWAYRTWSVEHPAEFGLLHGAPVPRYQAPARTAAAGARAGDLLAHAVEELCRLGLVDERGVEQRVRRLDRATRADGLTADLTGQAARHTGAPPRHSTGRRRTAPTEARRCRRPPRRLLNT